MKIAREPAIILTILATLVRLGVAHFVNPSPEVQAWVDAAVTAGAGLVVAMWVKHEGQVPALLGFVQALLALGIGFGFHITPDMQAAIMSIVGGLAALFIRQNVVAPVPANPEVMARRV